MDMRFTSSLPLAAFLLCGCVPNTSGIAETSASTTQSEDSETDDETSESSESGETGDCVGEDGCPCTPEGACDPGLVCVDDMCEPGSTGDGDGDGTTVGDGDGDPGCTAEGCMCDGSPGSCDPGLECDEGVCVELTCGDGVLDDGESCDDGNLDDGDGCDNDCTYTTIEIAAGGVHTCAEIEGGRVRCWGSGAFGNLGYGNTDDVGDDEAPAMAGDVSLPAAVAQIELGSAHTCARFDDMQARCWGEGAMGRLGYGATDDVGADAPLGDLPAIMLGGAPTAVTAGKDFSCALLMNGEIRCWGENGKGQLGQGDNVDIGDDEPPTDVPTISVGGQPFTALASGDGHTCALNDAGELYCWGNNNHGQLGYGNNQPLGDDEPLAGSGPVDLRPGDLPPEATVDQLALGKDHSCVLFSTGDVLCWGHNNRGQLGVGNDVNWGNDPDQFPSGHSYVTLDEPAVAIAAGGETSCAILDSGALRCWGKNDRGQLGLGTTDNLGDDEPPTDVDAIDFDGQRVRSVAVGISHVCALLDDYTLYCWGRNDDGRLGTGTTDQIGDDELPTDVSPVELLD